MVVGSGGGRGGPCGGFSGGAGGRKRRRRSIAARRRGEPLRRRPPRRKVGASHATGPRPVRVDEASTPVAKSPAMDFVLTLHGHLPYVLHHGRWPHGSVWLCEAAFDSYLPLIEALQALEKEKIPAPITLGITP